jgi:predicted Zn-dependent protease
VSSAIGIDQTPQGTRIAFRSRPSLVTVAFMLLWLAGWAVLLAAAVEGFGRWDAESVLRLFLVALGPLVLIPLVWVAFGKRESLTLSPGALLIERRAGPLTLRRSLEPLAIRDIRASPVVEGLLADLAAIRFFYSGGNGRVAIHTDANSISVGHQISERDASGLIDSLMPFLPHIATRPSEERFGNPPFAWRATAIMTMIMLWFALTVPVKLAITDRKTCFPDDDVRPSSPIDVSALRPAGRVHLVPIDDFPVERARAIADHFRRRFGVAVDVAAPIEWPLAAYDVRRDQMNSAAMLEIFERMAAADGERIVRIGLTARDMFNPAVGWRYVFSYRRNNRAAVVSTARMRHGCMGLDADDARVMSRLRKMVGKNIGVMYFGLEMSADPASMLYANIGGPQELDVMSEEF